MHERIARMNPLLRKILHIFSVTGTFMMLYGGIYLILKYTIGRIPIIQGLYIFGTVPLQIPLFMIITLLIIKRFIRISSPYQD
ncbi:hypothetical protein DI243_13790 [Paenibacillus polymyxa]|nr:hypothetical protein DI243_13790 [Paenibacillus polymyxa]